MSLTTFRVQSYLGVGLTSIRILYYIFTFQSTTFILTLENQIPGGLVMLSLPVMV